MKGDVLKDKDKVVSLDTAMGLSAISVYVNMPKQTYVLQDDGSYILMKTEDVDKSSRMIPAVTVGDMYNSLCDLYEYKVNGTTIYSMTESKEMDHTRVYTCVIDKFMDDYVVSYLDQNMEPMDNPMETTGKTEEEAIINMISKVFCKNEIVKELNLEEDERVF